MKLSDFEVDVDKQEQGAWVENIPDAGGLRLKVRGINNLGYRKLQQRLIEAIPRKKRMARTIDPEEMDRITSICLLECCLDDWDGLDNGDSGAPLPYSKEQARVLLTEPKFRRFRDAVVWAATVVEEAEQEQRKDITKN